MDLDTIFKQPIAHRGLHNRGNGIIENTSSAFARAIKGGYGIECDLQLSGDGVPVVFHDATIDRLTDQTGPVSKLSAGQLGRIAITGSSSGDCPQSFAELLVQINGAVPLVIELKRQENDDLGTLAQAAVAALADYRGPVAIKSFDPNLVSATRRYGFEGPIGIVSDRHDDEQSKNRFNAWQRFSLRHLLHKPNSKFDFISCHQHALRLPAVRIYRRFGMKVMTWTIRSYDEQTDGLRYADQIVFEGFLPQRV